MNTSRSLTLAVLVTCFVASVAFGAARPAQLPEAPPEAAKPAPVSDVSPAADPLKETPAQFDARMAWWREAKFGMFIHWGIYAVPAGEWKGQDVKGIGEWIMDRANIPIPDYEKLTKKFNPVKFDADEWARIAAEAGMKYVVITSKHHDGFCLFDTKSTDYDVVDATPYGKDLLIQLSAACRKRGIKFCTYYSIMDWHHPAQVKASAEKYNPSKMRPGRKAEYVTYMKQQLIDLLDTCDPEVLWFDGEWPSWWTEEDGRDLYTFLRQRKPHLIINNRVGKGRKGMEGMNKGDRKYVGDFGTPEQRIPAAGLPGVDWESCMTMNRTWGFKKSDHEWKSNETLIRNLIDITSKGGNFLLNVGPTAEGLIPGPSVQRLAAMGKWLKVNGESVYGTKATPIGLPSWGRCTRKALDGGKTRLYLHVFNWPADGKLVLPTLANEPAGAFLLDGGKKLSVAREGAKLTIALPPKSPDAIAAVVVLDVEGDPKVVKINPYADETPAQRDARMKWWREARFGMFIHWGVYSVPAGTYKGKQIPGIGEWIMNRGKIPVATYKQYAKKFNPVKYDPDAWVRLAKEAGMKYIVITSKHHDGFALFDSKVTDWDIVDATPYGKDLLKPLAEACKKHGLRLGFYYSQAQDWCHPGGAASRGQWDPAQKGSMDKYIRTIAVPQVKEILSNYGPLAVLWWDTPTDMNADRAKQLLPLIRLQPGIIINNRLGGGFKGDTDTPEQHIPAAGIPGRDWETCMTMNGTWGFKSYDHNWKPTQTLIRNLIDIASKGGNYLLNVGPTNEGVIPAPSITRLKEVGRWMKVNGASIYSTQATPIGRPAWGRCTRKGSTLYLHVFDWPEGKLDVAGLLSKPAKAYLLTEPDKKLAVATGDKKVLVTLPAQAPDPIASVVVLEFDGPIKVDASVLPKPKPKPKPGKGGSSRTAPTTPKVIEPDAGGVVTLKARNATLHGGTIKYENPADRDAIGYWTKVDDWVSWQLKLPQAGTYTVELTYACGATSGDSEYVLSVGKTEIKGLVKPTGDWGAFETIKLGDAKIPAGTSTLSIKPLTKPNLGVMNARSVILRPKK